MRWPKARQIEVPLPQIGFKSSVLELNRETTQLTRFALPRKNIPYTEYAYLFNLRCAGLAIGQPLTELFIRELGY